MKITKEEFISVIITLISVHLLICNTKLLWIADNAQGVMKFIWALVGLSYSILSAMSVAKINQMGYIIPFALLDSCGVLIEKYNYNSLIGWYFAVYTLVAIMLSWMAIHKGFEPENVIPEKKETSPEPALEPQKAIPPASTEFSTEQNELINSLTKKLNPSGFENRSKIISSIEDEKVKEFLSKRYLQ